MAKERIAQVAGKPSKPRFGATAVHSRFLKAGEFTVGFYAEHGPSNLIPHRTNGSRFTVRAALARSSYSFPFRLLEGFHVASRLDCLLVHAVRLRAIDCCRAGPRAGGRCQLRCQCLHKRVFKEVRDAGLCLRPELLADHRRAQEKRAMPEVNRTAITASAAL